MKIPYYIVDVFAERKFSGNQLAVFLNNNDLPADLMQDIAREMHFSETTFISPQKSGETAYPVRIFTPEHEVPFAGHPVLGTAFVIREMIMGRPENELILNLAVGKVPVIFSPEPGKPPVFWMKQPEPSFGRSYDPEGIAPVLSLPLGSIDTRFPIEEVSTGLPFIIVPLRSLEAVRSARINTEAYEALISGTEVKALHFFSPETYDPHHHLNARMFGPYYGITEDPATGSATGCLAAYLHKNRYFGTVPPVVMVEQGYEINRQSLLLCRVSEEPGEIKVEVGGSVFLVARGEMMI